MPHVSPGDPDDLVASTREAFTAAYAGPAAVVGHAPGRVNLIGEHTDYNGGLCLPVALPHRTYVAAAARSDGRLRIASRQQSDAWEGSLDDVAPGAVPGWAAYAAGVPWALRESGVDVPGADLLVDSTVPLGAGLSSSAAIECAVAMAVTALVGDGGDPRGARRAGRRVHAGRDRDRGCADGRHGPDRVDARASPGPRCSSTSPRDRAARCSSARRLPTCW